MTDTDFPTTPPMLAVGDIETYAELAEAGWCWIPSRRWFIHPSSNVAVEYCEDGGWLVLEPGHAPMWVDRLAWAAVFMRSASTDQAPTPKSMKLTAPADAKVQVHHDQHGITVELSWDDAQPHAWVQRAASFWSWGETSWYAQKEGDTYILRHDGARLGTADSLQGAAELVRSKTTKPGRYGSAADVIDPDWAHQTPSYLRERSPKT